MNDLVLIGTGFVLARVLYVWYMTPAKSHAGSPPSGARGPHDRR